MRRRDDARKKFDAMGTGRRVPDNRKLWLAIAGTVLLSLWLATSTGWAFESKHTSISEKHCRKFNVEKINGSEYAASRVCAGRGGYKVFIDEVDLRETLTVGRTMKQARKRTGGTRLLWCLQWL
jgi:hypothetical protein